MSKILAPGLPEVSLSTEETASAVSRLVRRGELRKIGPRLYTTRVDDNPADVVRENIWPLVGLYVPGGVVGYRTAIEGKPTPSGTVFLSGHRLRRIDLDGLKIRVVSGSGALEGDMPFIGGLFHASRARAMLEVLRPARARAVEARGLARADIEARLDRDLELGSERALNTLRDLARKLAPLLDAEEQFAELDAMIGTLLGTRSRAPTSPNAVARLSKPPYDAKRLQLFETLRSALVASSLPSRPDLAHTGPAFRHLSFLDAYFSNFIEGTRFELEEAREIIFEDHILPNRPADSHDILGTYKLVGDPGFLRTSVTYLADGDAFIARLRTAHATVMSGRSENTPGRFKDRVNRAGNSVFVHPDMVTGTLLQGFAIARSLERAFARAAAVMFIISEVHPFVDGNGRIARAFMNAELYAANECRILIPTVFREDYLTVLRALTRSAHPDPFIGALEQAQRATGLIDYTDLDRAIGDLRGMNAFEEAGEGSRLRIPALHSTALARSRT